MTNTQVFGLSPKTNAGPGNQAFADPSPGPPIRVQPAKNADAKFSDPSPGAPIQAQRVEKAEQAQFSDPTPGAPIPIQAAAQAPAAAQQKQGVAGTQAQIASPAAGLVTQGPGTEVVNGPMIKAGTQAQVAAPAPELRAQSASDLNAGSGMAAAAILPGEKSINLLAGTAQTQQAQQAQQSLLQSAPLGTQQGQQAQAGQQGQSIQVQKLSQESTPTMSLGTPGQEVEKFQFVGQININLASSDPRNLGARGQLMPRIQLVIQTEKEVLVSMDGDMRQYLIGVSGSSIPVGTTVIPGRTLGGADRSVNLTGLYVIGSWIVSFSTITITGLFTRILHRQKYRRQLKASMLRV